MIPHVLLLFLCLVVAVVSYRTPEQWASSNDNNYALFWKNLTVVRDSDGNNIISEEVYNGDDDPKEDIAGRPVLALLDDEMMYKPWESTVYLHFYRRDDHAFVDLKFDPCSDLDYYSDAWKEQGCNRTALTTTEELSSVGEAASPTPDDDYEAASPTPDDDYDEGEDEFDIDEEASDHAFIGEEEGEEVTELEGVLAEEEEDTSGTMFRDYFDENGTYVGPDYSNNRLHPDGPDGGGWRLSQAFVVDKKTNTMFRWENAASTLGVNHDLDFLFCETVKFTLTGEDGETTATMSFENVLFSSFLELRRTSYDMKLNNYVGMRITSPCQEDEICEAVNGNVACLATADGKTTSRKDYFANITTLEYADGVRMEEA